MNDTEKYLFDLNGYLHIEGLLSGPDVRACLGAVDQLEGYFRKNIDAEPQLTGFSNIRYRFNAEYGCHSYKNTSGGGLQYVIDDFLNASPSFDRLVGHEPTMRYMREVATGPFRIGSSEIRYRYKSNTTHTHMGGRMDPRNHYEFIGRKMYDSDAQVWRVIDVNLLAVRFLYALHDIPVESGPLCVVPGSHKSNYFSPFSDEDPLREPGMVPLPMKAGDAIMFTENLRHGGFPNLSDAPRKTLHLMIAPAWVASQSPIHWNDRVYVSPDSWNRYTEQQRAVLPPPTVAAELELRAMRDEVRRLREQVESFEKQSPPTPPPTPAAPKGIWASMSSFLARKR